MPEKAVLVIDMINDFIKDAYESDGSKLEGKLVVPGAHTIIPHISDLVDAAHEHDVPVYYLCDNHETDDKEFEQFPPHAIKDSPGAYVISELEVRAGEVIPKTTFSGFKGTELYEKLKKDDVAQLYLTGVCTEICVLHTANDALGKGYEVRIVEDAVQALDVDKSSEIYSDLCSKGAKRLTTETALKYLKKK